MTLYDLILTRYGDARALYDLPVGVGVALVFKAHEEAVRERIRDEWVTLLPWMQAGHLKLIQFDDYFDQRTGRNIDRRPADQIIAELEKLHGRRLV